MKLEVFAKENNFRLASFESIHRAHYGKGKRIKTQKLWSYRLLSPLLGQEIDVQHKCYSGILCHSLGSTRKEARSNLIDRIRGATLVCGCSRNIKVRVPGNLK